MKLPLGNGDMGVSRQCEIAILPDSSLETAGRRISSFARLLDESEPTAGKRA